MPGSSIWQIVVNTLVFVSAVCMHSTDLCVRSFRFLSLHFLALLPLPVCCKTKRRERTAVTSFMSRRGSLYTMCPTHLANPGRQHITKQAGTRCSRGGGAGGGSRGGGGQRRGGGGTPCQRSQSLAESVCHQDFD